MKVHRFEREAHETAALSSTHTIQVYDFGITEDGDFYYVMELLVGPQISSDGARVRPARSGDGRSFLLRQVCHSLATRMPAVSSTVTSSRPTSMCAGWVSTTTS